MFWHSTIIFLGTSRRASGVWASHGGLIALNYALAHSDTIDAVAVWNSNFNGGIENSAAKAILYAERMLKGSDVPKARSCRN